MRFKKFLTDKVTLLKSNGSAHENIEASILSENILIDDTSLPIEPGDKIMRRLPSGVEEIYVITDPGFHEAFATFPAHYQIKYQREGMTNPTVTQDNTTYNISGSFTRVNVNSLDQSINIVDAEVGITIDQVRSLLHDQISNAEERAKLLAKLDELQQAHGTKNFTEVYKEFVILAANHMSVIAPLMPALSALL